MTANGLPSHRGSLNRESIVDYESPNQSLQLATSAQMRSREKHGAHNASEGSSMRLISKLTILTAALGLAASPALALPGKPPSPPGAQNGTTGTTGPTGATGQHGPPSGGSTPTAQAKAYGYYCQNQSKKHVAGQKGTPFSQCVAAMAKLASGKTKSPQAACAGMSKTHKAGEKGTPFSRCVAAGAKLLKTQH
jgi:hypothetical protein